MMTNESKKSEIARISPRNSQILKEIIHILNNSLGRALREFIDIIYESILYGNTTDKVLRSVFLDQLKCIGEALNQLSDTKVVVGVLEKTRRIHLKLMDFLNKLSDEINSFEDIIVKHLKNFSLTFQSFKLLNSIVEDLIDDALISGISDDKIFQVKNNLKLIKRIKEFIKFNSDWLEAMMVESIAFKEYLIIEVKIFKNNIKMGELIKDKEFVVRNEDFQKFLTIRKSRLKIL
ncbi:hypothetical protein NCAS_0H01340 [Naumovozyma castellii]|uniref:Uncharacterized protein n=1 Tax=Naumovozyma castellii TaxID=27288 RepID=G0VIW7_NAUCA|nr:hypothetical protein NCAS_0H01340 [Naumovozyma castellii CBS 4309]CCC71444.1 hypothetical protein NCAS_0H01340 [Naumovozyma castellii CBS 4309]